MRSAPVESFEIIDILFLKQKGGQLIFETQGAALLFSLIVWLWYKQ